MAAISLTESGIQQAKRALQDHYPEAKSSYLTESLAAACGFKTHAALIDRMKNSNPSDPEIVLLREDLFLGRYSELQGRPIEPYEELTFDFLMYEGAEIIPTLSPRYATIDYRRSMRLRAWRNAMVATINAGIEQRHFSVRAGDNRWPGHSNDQFDRGECHVFQFSIGDIPAFGYVYDAGYDELSIHAALWPTPDGERRVRSMNAGFAAGSLFATGYLERRDGAWLQVPSSGMVGAWNFNCRKEKLAEIASIGIAPKGYADRGNFKV